MSEVSSTQIIICGKVQNGRFLSSSCVKFLSLFSTWPFSFLSVFFSSSYFEFDSFLGSTNCCSLPYKTSNIRAQRSYAVRQIYIYMRRWNDDNFFLRSFSSSLEGEAWGGWRGGRGQIDPKFACKLIFWLTCTIDVVNLHWYRIFVVKKYD